MTSPVQTQAHPAEIKRVELPTPQRKGIPFFRLRVGLGVTIFGLFFLLLGARPSMFGLDRSAVIGFVQIATMEVGLAIICVGGYISLAALWNGNPRTIAADIGLRLVSTGYVISVFTGMADMFGLGSHRYPVLPYFGPLQARGFEFGELIIAIGFLLLLPIWKRKPS
jgi:hypothetical protein